LTLEQRDAEAAIRQTISALHTELLKPGLTEFQREELLKKLETAETEYTLFHQRMRRENPAFAGLVSPETASAEDVQANLLDDETALIEYFIGDQESFLFCLTRSDFSVQPLPEGKSLLQKAADYAKLLSQKEPEKFQAYEAGRSLYRQLLGPVSGRIASLKRLIIVPDGSLHYLPFDALVQESQQQADSQDKRTSFMVQNYLVSYVPSASSLLALLKRKREADPRRVLLAFADPVYEMGKTSRKRFSSDEIVREFYLKQGFDLYPLPHTAAEVKRIARALKANPQDIFTREKAREEKLKEISLKDFRIIHFATHALLDERAAMRSALVLSLDEDPREDGFFQAREIWSSEFNADLVVLSACQTGKGRLEKGEGVSGLTSAFLHAGARCVLATLWNINDRTSAEIMGHFYDFLSRGKSPEEALQLAKVRMIRTDHNHPFYWAGFVLKGNSKGPVYKGK
jgi:CHAT domain-containing protein